MSTPHWELSVLSRAVGYKNLSVAARNIGISQPQLSRIVTRIENQFAVVLLDRASRRNSGWTPTAFKLAQTYSSQARALEKELEKTLGLSAPKELKTGALEGLVSVATAFCHNALKSTQIRTVELDVHDLNVLEELFFKNEYDCIFVSREFPKKKFKYSLNLGRQALSLVTTSQTTLVLSSFERQTMGRSFKRGKHRKILVSNSLLARKHFIETYGGAGNIPSQVYRGHAPSDATSPVYLIASDMMSPALWKRICGFKF